MTLKRTAILRRRPDADYASVPVRKPATEPKPAKGPRLRKCAVQACRAPFAPRNMMHKACSPECAVVLALNARRKLERKSDRERRADLRTKGDHTAAAQVEFNSYTRKRDQIAGYPCISSGKPLDWSGNNVDAGHYRSRGSAPHLRFNEDNVHAQSKQENRYASGNATDYRIGLIARIGLARVEALEADQTARHYTVDDLIAIKLHYRAKTRALTKETT